jgi:hypothetical protein
VTVMLHSGACLLRQYTTFAGIVHGQKTRKFFRKLVTRGYATAYACRHNRGRVYHIHHKALYRAIGVTDSRHRRPLSAARVIRGLMMLDAVLANPELIWLATEDEKRAHLMAMTPVATDKLPHVSPAVGRSSDIRMFPDKVPIGLDLTGGWVIVYLADDAELDPYRAFLQRHADLLAVLAAWTLRIVAPPGLETLGERCQTLVKEELASPVRREVADRLKWYFEQRRAHELESARLEDEETYYLSRAGFRAPRFQVLYKRWSREGNAALDYATSQAIADAIERGSGRVECVVLPHQYHHLSPVLSATRGAGKGADEGEHTPPQPRPQVSPLNPPFNAIRDDRLKTSPSSCQSLVP